MGEKKYIAYIHTSPSGKKYIGITHLSTQKRWKNGKGYKNSPHFLYAIQKYGWESFLHEIVADNLTLSGATALEIALIKLYKTTNQEFGYNCSTGGESGRIGCVVSNETRAKISAASKLRKHTEETREKMRIAALGRKHTKESIAKMNKPKSAEHCLKNGKSHSKQVIQYQNGVEIARFYSIKEAAKNTKTDVTGISRCCLGKLKTSGGFTWAFT